MKKDMKKNILVALLLALGVLFSQIVPPFLGGMRFDFLLIFMVISIVLTVDIKTTFLVGILGGILSAVISTFPGGQIPNFIEKIVVAFYILAIVKIFKANMNIYLLGFIALTSTILSGSLFLFLAKISVGLPVSLKSLILTVVLPTSLINSIGTVFMYKIVQKSLKHSGMSLE